MITIIKIKAGADKFKVFSKKSFLKKDLIELNEKI